VKQRESRAKRSSEQIRRKREKDAERKRRKRGIVKQEILEG
jgi:hypothetical protein